MLKEVMKVVNKDFLDIKSLVHRVNSVCDEEEEYEKELKELIKKVESFAKSLNEIKLAISKSDNSAPVELANAPEWFTILMKRVVEELETKMESNKPLRNALTVEEHQKGFAAKIADHFVIMADNFFRLM